MKNIAIILIVLCSIQVSAQKKIKNLSVFVTENFDPKTSITVTALNNDPVLAVNHLKNSLLMNGFKVISERVAQEKVEMSNKGEVTDTTFNQDVSVGKTTYVKSVYAITMSYQYRADMGCGGQVISNLTGQIVDLANDGELVATFNFSQNSFQGKCTLTIMQALAAKLKKD